MQKLDNYNLWKQAVVYSRYQGHHTCATCHVKDNMSLYPVAVKVLYVPLIIMSDT